jgi:hypothetical protein
VLYSDSLIEVVENAEHLIDVMKSKEVKVSTHEEG